MPLQGGAPKKTPKAGDFIFGENSLEGGFPKKPLKPKILFLAKILLKAVLLKNP